MTPVAAASILAPIGVRHHGCRAPIGALFALLFAVLLPVVLARAAAAEELPGAIDGESASASSVCAIRLGSDERPGIADGVSQAEPSPVSLLAHELSGDVGPTQGWALLAPDEKDLSDENVLPKRAGPDWPGIARDTGFFFAYQVISVGILYALPGDVNRWSNKDVSFENWWDNVKSPPVWDSDPWATNFISHPYWGASYYIRARERGFGKFASFGYSVLLSTLYEYGAEAFFEQPSAQDLMITPILGSLIGAFVFEPIRDWIKLKPEVKWYDQAILMATDPFGTLNSVFEVMLGIKSEILFRPTPPPPRGTATRSRALGLGEDTAPGPMAQA